MNENNIASLNHLSLLELIAIHKYLKISYPYEFSYVDGDPTKVFISYPDNVRDYVSVYIDYENRELSISSLGECKIVSYRLQDDIDPLEYISRVAFLTESVINILDEYIKYYED